MEWEANSKLMKKDLQKQKKDFLMMKNRYVCQKCEVSNLKIGIKEQKI